ncbi:MAG TPA: outer membrane protein transport protein [Mesorhizobium sp.]|jgi:long-chain fatty acid transport protein|nr:outer membrane protein transport protein [Mesorhizobium sp.]
MRSLISRALFVAGASALAVASAQAGGFDRGGVQVDLLFDPARIATEAGVTYVSPQRELKNVQRATSSTDPLADRIRAGLIARGIDRDRATGVANSLRRPPLFSGSVEVEGDYAVPRLGAKFNIFEPVDCLATYTQPYGADADYGTNNAYSPTAVEFEVDSHDFGLTCSYKFDLAGGQFRVIGGTSYQQLDAYLARQTLLDFGNEGIGTFELSDEAWSYRVGAAYEIPEIALRALVLYSGRYEYDLTGTVDTTGFGPTGTVLAPLPGPFSPFSPRLTTGVFDVDAQTEIPQALDIRLQSGLAEGLLGFVNIRWQDWSQLQRVRINGVVSPATGQVSPTTSFDAFYEDGWTVTAGLGKKFTDTFSGLASVTWDKGTSTFYGSQTDVYTVALGGSYTPTENVELRFGGSVGVLTGGRSDFIAEQDPANYVSYEFDADTVVAGSASIKVKF